MAGTIRKVDKLKARVSAVAGTRLLELVRAAIFGRDTG